MIKAFTLMELLVAMLISSIVISISYISYDIIYKQYFSYKENNQSITQTALINSLINRDIFEAEFMQANDKEIVLTYRNKSALYYIFDTPYLIRKTETSKDTFELDIENIHFKFQGEERQMKYSLIDEFYFEAPFLEKKEYFRYKKLYGADVLMTAEQGNTVIQ